MTRTRNGVSGTVRGITRKALTGGELDRAAIRKVTADAMKVVRQAAAVNGPGARKNLAELEQLFVKAVRKAATTGKGAASQSMNATLASGAVAARIASGMLAGIADTLAQKTPRRTR